jgi:hypothetical protein
VVAVVLQVLRNAYGSVFTPSYILFVVMLGLHLIHTCLPANNTCLPTIL